MAYTRWSDSDWYIYYQASDKTHRNQSTIVLHRRLCAQQQLKYPEVVKILRSGDLGKVNWLEDEHDEALVRECLEDFVRDVESEFQENDNGQI